MAAHLLLCLLLLLLLPTISLCLHLDTSDSTVVPAKHARSLLIAAAPPPAPPPTPSPVATHNSQHHKRHKLRNAVAGFTSGVTGGLLLGLFICLLFRLTLSCIRGRFTTHNDPTIFFPLIKRTEDLAFLQSPHTLASLDIIGRGGCGEVYRKQIDSVDPPLTLAIKKIQCGPDLSQKTRDIWMRQVRSEILTVGRIRHRNLLPLVAHVPRPDCQYLVYEYMKNGSLHDTLTDGQRQLDWLSRHKIILGIASGLEYLHHSHKPRIVHRDLKPGNILLDDDMEARIADFGMAKEIPDANTHMTTANVAGTIGYIAPEYYQTMKFTTKCDVYSFGVILGVLVMGKLPSDPFFQETREVSSVKWLRNVVASEEAEVAIDPKMRGNGYEEQMLLVARIACFCSAENPKERPSSKDVRAMLSQIVH